MRADTPPNARLVRSTTAPGTGLRLRLSRFGVVLCYLACVTIPWTGVKVGGVRVGDIFLLLAVVVLVAADLDHRMPSFAPWVWFFVVTIVMVGVLHEIFPTPQTYFDNHLGVDGITIVRGKIGIGGGNLSVMLRFLIAIVGLPLMFARAFYFDPRALRRSAIAFTVGAAVGALIAFTDGQGLTSIGVRLTGIADGGDRSTGLTESPNFVALGVVFGLPFVLWQLVDPSRRNRLWAALGLACMLLGLYNSGSRSGAGAAAIAMLLSFALIRRYRRLLPAVGAVLVVIATIAFIAHPALGDSVLRALRLTGDQGEGSDIARNVVNDQAGLDFLRSPIDGVGFQVAGEAHIVYLQALAAGGLILLTGYSLFLLASMVRCLRLFVVDDFAAPLFVSILSGAIFNAAQNALTLRIVYVPAMLAAALPLTKSPSMRRLTRTAYDRLQDAAVRAGRSPLA